MFFKAEALVESKISRCINNETLERVRDACRNYFGNIINYNKERDIYRIIYRLDDMCNHQ